MGSSMIDDDLEFDETKVALIGIGSLVVLLFVELIQSGSGYQLALSIVNAVLVSLFFVKAMIEIERRGKAITKFRSRPSRMREVLADLEHDQWVGLTKYYAYEDDEIDVSDDKLDYWKDLWVDYEELSEEDKDKDRKYADKVIEKLEEVDYYG